MEYRYKRDLKNSFMIIDAALGDMGYEKDILRYNDIDVLVPFHTLDINNKTQVWYDITGMVSLSDYMMQQGININLIRKVLWYLKTAIDEVSRYLIDVNHLLLDAESIYVIKNNTEWKLMFIYYPDNESEAGLESVLQFLMSNADSESMDFCLKLYDAASDGVNIDGLIKLIDDELSDSRKDIENHIETVDMDENIDSIDQLPKEDLTHVDDSLYDIFEDDYENKKSLLEKLIDKVKSYISSNLHIKITNKNTKTDDSFSDFVVEPDVKLYEPTVLLKSMDDDIADVTDNVYNLKYVGDNHNDNIRIDKDEFLLGSSKEGNDSVINSPVISRFHAKIIREGKKLYIEDLNSTNGTCVNGKLLGYKDRICLNHNDEIMFADECYKVV